MTTYAPAPDIEAAAVAYLSGHFPGAWVGVQRPFEADWQEPDDRLTIHVSLADGGTPRSLVLDSWVLAVEVWHADSIVAADSAGQVFGRLNAWHGRHSGVLLYDVSASRPRSLPDPLTRFPRYVLTASGLSRLSGV